MVEIVYDYIWVIFYLVLFELILNVDAIGVNIFMYLGNCFFLIGCYYLGVDLYCYVMFEYFIENVLNGFCRMNMIVCDGGEAWKMESYNYYDIYGELL
jgi:hypothetical protein